MTVDDPKFVNGAIASTAEAYKSIIDFNKTVMTLASTVLTAQMAYLVFSTSSFAWNNFISSFLLVCSSLFCLLSFGQAILTVKDAKSRPRTIVFANVGAVLLFLGILSLPFINWSRRESIDQILKSVGSETTSFSKKLAADSCYRIELNNDQCKLYYKNDTAAILVTYSVRDNQIISIK